MPASAVPFREDNYFTSALEAEFPAPAVDETKGLIAEAALRVYAKTADRLQPNRQRLHHYDRELNSVTHFVPPSYVQETKTDGRDMNTASVVRKFPSTNERITKEQTAERVSFALQAWGKERSTPIKRIQNIAKVNRKTAEAWWHGRYPPQSDNLFTLARKIPELKAECARLLEMEQDGEPGFSRELIHLMQKYVR
jgi:hypothetical protein